VGKSLKFTLVMAALLILPWLTSIAYANSNGDSAPGEVRVEVADRAAAPEATIFGCAFDSVTPGDLFYIDATGSPGDLAVNLYITNAQELTHYLRYLILKVSVSSESQDGQWRQAPLRGGSAPEGGTYLTLQNSPVKFLMPGNSRYKVSIDSGSYYSLPVRAGSSNKPPHFFLTVDPA
jgi:hypothetical protein